MKSLFRENKLIFRNNLETSQNSSEEFQNNTQNPESEQIQTRTNQQVSNVLPRDTNPESNDQNEVTQETEDQKDQKAQKKLEKKERKKAKKKTKVKKSGPSELQQKIYAGLGLGENGEPQIWQEEVNPTAKKIFIDGVVTNFSRNTYEVLEPTGSALRSAAKIFTDPLKGAWNLATNFKKSIKKAPKNIGKYLLGNPLRILSSTARAGANIVKWPFSFTHNFFRHSIVGTYKLFNNWASDAPLVGWLSENIVMKTLKTAQFGLMSLDYVTSAVSEGTRKIDHKIRDNLQA